VRNLQLPLTYATTQRAEPDIPVASEAPQPGRGRSQKPQLSEGALVPGGRGPQISRRPRGDFIRDWGPGGGGRLPSVPFFAAPGFDVPRTFFPSRLRPRESVLVSRSRWSGDGRPKKVLLEGRSLIPSEPPPDCRSPAAANCLGGLGWSRLALRAARP